MPSIFPKWQKPIDNSTVLRAERARKREEQREQERDRAVENYVMEEVVTTEEEQDFENKGIEIDSFEYSIISIIIIIIIIIYLLIAFCGTRFTGFSTKSYLFGA